MSSPVEAPDRPACAGEEKEGKVIFRHPPGPCRDLFTQKGLGEVVGLQFGQHRPFLYLRRQTPQNPADIAGAVGVTVDVEVRYAVR